MCQMRHAQAPKPIKERSHLTRDLVIVSVAIVGIVLILTAVASFAFSVYGCFGGCGTIPHIEAVTCHSDSRSCMLEVAGGPNSDVGADVISCAFTVGNEAVNGTVVSAANGPQVVISVPPSHAVTVYCAGFPDAPLSGGQVQGQLQTRGGWLLPFSATWT